MIGRLRVFAVTGITTLAVAGGAYGASQAVFVGTSGNDTIYGTAHGDVIHGRSGNDSLHGRAGNDVIWGGRGADAEFGGPGNDTLYALADDNRLDVVNCGPGFDTAWLNVNERGLYRVVSCEIVNRVVPGPAQLAEDVTG